MTEALAAVRERIQWPAQYRGKPLLECVGLIARAASYGHDITDELAWLRQQGTLGEEAAASIEEACTH